MKYLYLHLTDNVICLVQGISESSTLFPFLLVFFIITLFDHFTSLSTISEAEEKVNPTRYPWQHGKVPKGNEWAPSLPGPPFPSQSHPLTCCSPLDCLSCSSARSTFDSVFACNNLIDFTVFAFAVVVLAFVVVAFYYYLFVKRF